MCSNADKQSMPLLDANNAIDAHKLSLALTRNTAPNQEVGAFLTELDDSCEAHQKHKERMRTSFVRFLLRHPKFAPLMDYVDCRGTSMPRLFAACSSVKGEDVSVKAKVANTMLAEFSALLQMKNPAKAVRSSNHPVIPRCL